MNLLGINLFVKKDIGLRGSGSISAPTVEIVDISAGANHTILLVKNNIT